MNEESPDRLLDQLLDRRLSKAEFESLEAAMQGSRTLRDRFRKLKELSAALELEFGEPIARKSAPDRADGSAGGVRGKEAASLEPWRGLAPSGTRRDWRGAAVSFFVGAIAASILLAALVGIPSTSEDIASQLAEIGAIATLTGMVDCEWAEGFEGPVYGGFVTPGEEIRIVSGLAQLTFESGAKIVLEGPAHFTPHEKLYASLAFGRATAVVNEEAIGFRVNTPTAEVIDLGTSFGVDVSDTGDSEVHVLEGEVLTRPISEAGEEEFVHLVKDMAVRITSEDHQMVAIEAALDGFIDDVRPQLMPDDDRQLPVGRALALWLAADHLVEKDDKGGVIAWNDILIGDNRSDEIAWQSDAEFRPRWVDDAIGGKPAIRFSRKYDHLVTTPLPTTNNQTVFLVFRQSQRPDVGVQRQLLSYNGPPVRYVEDLSEPGVLQIDDSNSPGRFYAQVFKQTKRSRLAGARDERLVGFSVGEVSTREAVPLNEVVVLGYVYSRRDNHSAMYLNDVLQGEADAPFDIAINSRKVIGKHGKPDFKSFAGDIAEVVIYNDRLTGPEITAVSQYLMTKYNDEHGPPRPDGSGDQL